MTSDAIELFSALMRNTYQLLISTTIPGTNISAFNLLFGLFLFKMMLNILKTMLGIGGGLADMKKISDASKQTDRKGK